MDKTSKKNSTRKNELPEHSIQLDGNKYLKMDVKDKKLVGIRRNERILKGLTTQTRDLIESIKLPQCRTETLTIYE